MTITEITPLVRDYKVNRETLRERVETCKADQLAVLRRKLPGIKAASAQTRDAKARLEAAIEAHPDLFKKPKTQTIEGIKVGLAKGRGKVTVGKNAVDLIKKHFPEQFDTLVKTEQKPIAKALQGLSAGDLKRIGCQVTDTGDQIVISVPKDDLDKLVDSLLEDAPEQ